MNRLALLGLALLLTFSATAQNFRFTEAQRLARRYGKLILLQYQPAPCPKCDEAFESATRDTAVLERLRHQFVFFRLMPDQPDLAEVASRYKLENKPRYYFIDTSGRIIHSYTSVTKSSDLNREMNSALAKANAHSRLGTYEKAYAGGDRSPQLLESLLVERKSLGFDTDSLLDEYATSLPPDSLKSMRVLQFIAGMAPLLGSRADAVFRGDQLRFDNAWYVFPMRRRVLLNTEIIAKSRKRAIADGNEIYAMQVAAFAQSTYVGDTTAGMRAYENVLMDFYRELKDTAHYLPLASAYYDRYLMRLSIDSLKRSDSLEESRLRRDLGPGSYSPAATAFSHELMRAAYSILVYSTDPAYLALATRWIEAALKARTEPDPLDIYARLLYAQGQRSEAFATEEAAINLLKKEGKDASEKEAILEGMKKGKLNRVYYTTR